MHTQRHTANENRDAYRQKYDAEIRQWEAKCQGLKAEVDKMSADAQLKFKPNVDKVDNAMNVARAKWDQLTAAAEDKWEELKADAESAWLDVKAKLEGAYDALKGHKAN
jgi:hypothetical protein